VTSRRHDKRIIGGEGVTWVGAIHRFPGVTVGDAKSVEGLPAGPETYARGVRGVIEIPEDDHMQLPVPDVAFDAAGARDGLKLSLPAVAEFVRRLVMRDEDGAKWRRELDRGQHRRRPGEADPTGDVQIDCANITERESAT
jgi:hypothetical protein